MKKILLLLTVFVGLTVVAQPITVNTDTYTVPQLVNQVLINSPCVSATNVSWSTGSNFGSTNGIGFFQNGNSAFPIPSGVILTTGNAMNAPGPNNTMLDDGTDSWPGDASLEATLSQAGIAMSSVNATVLEFDFTPLSSSFSFDFVFASEEYGNFQCQFSDAFAFLLTNVNTGQTTNLAVVPGSNSPISVVTIRDFLYNSGCPSANEQFFGSFNGGSAAATSATNFNGQTVLMNASAVLTPNTPYHIKLVIADRTDHQSDSAIFIASDSFNIGQDVLGNDLTVAANNAVCPGETYTILSGLNPANYSFTWKRNNVVVAGQNGPNLTVNLGGTYELIYDNLNDGCPAQSDTVVVQYYPAMVTQNPVNLTKCDTGAATYAYTLSTNTPVVSANINPAPIVSYFASQADADNNVNALPDQYTAAPGTTVYVRIQKSNTGCHIVKTFTLGTTVPPTATQPADMSRCERSYTLHNAIFNLSEQNPAILNGQPAGVNQVSFYLSQADALSGSNPISATGHIAYEGTVVYVRVQNAADPTCFATTSFTLHAIPLPLVDQMDDVIVCESYTLPPLVNGNYFTGPNGTGDPLPAGTVIEDTTDIYIYNTTGTEPECTASDTFTVTVIKPEDFQPENVTKCGSYTLPGLQYGAYFSAAHGQGTEIAPGTQISSSQTVHYYLITDTEPACEVDTQFQVNIVPGINVGEHENVFDCNAYVLPNLTVGHYFTQPAGQGDQVAAGTVVTATQTFYIYGETGSTPNCTDEDSFTVFIGYDAPVDIDQCEPYTLPELPNIGGYYTAGGGQGTQIPAGTVLTGEQTIYLYIPGDCTIDASFHVSIEQPPVDTLTDVNVCGSYALPQITNGQYYDAPGGTGNLLLAGDVIVDSKTIYIYSGTSSCSNQSSFEVTIQPAAMIDSRASVSPCNSYTLTPLVAGNYYTGPGGTGTLLTAGTVVTATQTVYIYAPGNETTCASENSFVIDIFPLEADAPAPVSVCDQYVLPALTIGNYFTLSGGPNTAGNVMLNAGDVVTASTTLFIYTESGERINCFDENTFDITITVTPDVAAQPAVKVCESYTLPALTVGDYYTGQGKTGSLMHAGDVLTASQTLYVYAENGSCADEETLVVTVFNAPQLPNVVTCSSYTLPALSGAGYFTQSGGTGQQLVPGSAITTSRTVYVYAHSPFNPSCTDETSFEVTVVPQPVAHSVSAALTTVCDEDGTNDGVTAFDFTALNATVLGSQTGSEFQVTYHNTLADAQSGANAVTVSDQAVVYARVVNTQAPDCYDTVAISTTVHLLPEPTPVDGYLCLDQETGTLLSPYVIYSNLSASAYAIEWFDGLGNLIGTGSSFTAETPGEYTVLAVNNATGCSSLPVTVTVTASEPAELSYSVSDSFSSHPSLTIHAIGVGNYEYSIDGGAWQSSPEFAGMGSGIHQVLVRDVNGCQSATIEVMLVNYPHFFTPNGDGIHDKWNIWDLYQQPDAMIRIYDRYGKFLYEMTPVSNGWDGTLNGKLLPSTDYWFAVDYMENGKKTEFRAHFTLKR